MPFNSTFHPRETVIDDANWRQHAGVDPVIDGEQMSRGLERRNEPFCGAGPFMQRFDLPLIPRDEWDERIEEMERTKTRLSDIVKRAGVKVKNQNGTNYCWINAPVFACECLAAFAGQPYVPLSPASVGAKIKNFRNVGGWGTQGVKYLVEHGAVPESLWPANAIDRRYDTADANAQRTRFQVDEWYDLEPKNLDQLMTCLFYRIPVPVGLMWWSHEVTAMDPVKRGRDYGFRHGNSWGTNYGEQGYGIVLGSRALADDQVAPKLTTAA